nr:lipocalin family protein [Spirochaetota bacterium]
MDKKTRSITMPCLMAVFLTACITCDTARHPELATVKAVDLARYTGTWHEIARLPNSFEKGLVCVTATYTLRPDGKIGVVNRGRMESDRRRDKSATAVGWVPDAAHPGRLLVRFFWPFNGDYWIIKLDERNYAWALVGEPSRKYLWILARERALDAATYAELVDEARRAGFDVDRLYPVPQDCD